MSRIQASRRNHYVRVRDDRRRGISPWTIVGWCLVAFIAAWFALFVFLTLLGIGLASGG